MFFITSKRSKQLLINENFIHNLRSLNKETKTWRCKDRKCPGAVITTTSDTILSSIGHNHANHEREITQLILMQDIKEIAKGSAYTNRQIYTKEILEKDKIIKIEKKSLYKNMNRSRVKDVSQIESENGIPIHLKLTFKKENFVLCNVDHLKIFCTTRNVEYLANSTVWLADGTFLSAPRDYAQLYVIYGYIFNKCVPLVYIVSKDRTESLYLEAFRVIQQYMGSSLPEQILIDCEKAAANAFITVWPNSKVKHCLTHFSATIHRKIMKYNLVYDLQTNMAFKALVQQLKSIVFLPCWRFLACFDYLTNEFANLNNNRVSLFLADFKKNYIANIDGTKVLKEEFSYYDNILMSKPCTTNCAEAYNNAISKDLSYAKVSLYVFINVLRMRQSYIDNEIGNALRNPTAVYSTNTQIKKMAKITDILKCCNMYRPQDLLVSLALLYNWIN